MTTFERGKVARSGAQRLGGVASKGDARNSRREGLRQTELDVAGMEVSKRGDVRLRPKVSEGLTFDDKKGISVNPGQGLELKDGKLHVKPARVTKSLVDRTGGTVSPVALNEVTSFAQANDAIATLNAHIEDLKTALRQAGLGS